MTKRVWVLLMALTSCKTIHRPSAATKVVGGSVAINGQFPSAVQLLRCSASKIGQRAFLTAAHCVMDKKTGGLRNEVSQDKLLSIRHGVLSEDAETYQVTIQHVAVHATYVAKTLELAGTNAKDKAYQSAVDLAVIFVKEETPFIRTAKLSERSPKAGDQIVLSGFGCEELPNDPLNSDGRVSTSGGEEEVNSYRLKYFATPMSGRENHYGFVNDIRGPLNDLKFKLCPGDSGSGVYVVSQGVGVPTNKGAESQVFTEIVGINAWTDVFKSSFTLLNVGRPQNFRQCILELLNDEGRQSAADGLIEMCKE